jgi:glutamate-1-semialdehyde aminotransferase
VRPADLAIPRGAASADTLRRVLAERFPEYGECHLFAARGDAIEEVIAAARAVAGASGEIVRFRGCRHGHLDPRFPTSSDVERPKRIHVYRAEASTDGLRHFRFGDAPTLEAFLANRAGSVAAVLVEPLPLAMGLAIPPADFLPRLRAASQENGAWCVFDEGRAGVRFGASGAGARLGVEADVLVFGEALTAGISFGAAMIRLDARGSERANAILRDRARPPEARTIEAAADCLLRAADPALVARLDSLGARLARGLEAAASDLESDVSIERFGSAVGIVFPGRSLSEPADAFRYDWQRYAAFARDLAAGGVHIPSHPMVPMFVASAHTASEIDRAVESAARALENDAGAARGATLGVDPDRGGPARAPEAT